jgi:hypothetical protein
MSREKSDHILAAVKAGLHLLPHVGGAIASLIDDYVPKATERAMQKTMEQLSAKLIALEGRTDVDAVDNEDFAELFKSCYLVAIRSQREEKLRAAANLFANLLLKPGDAGKSSYEELDHFVRCLEALSIGALSVLGAARHIIRSAPTGPIDFQFHQLRGTFREFEPSFLMSLVSELRSLNLLHVRVPTIETADYGNFAIELTPVGRRFVERFIEGEM